MNVNHSFKLYQRVIDECDVTKILYWNLSGRRREASRLYDIYDEIKALLCNKFPKNKILTYNQ
jgi:hypothetical protein